jgi:hypothetical protein
MRLSDVASLIFKRNITNSTVSLGTVQYKVSDVSGNQVHNEQSESAEVCSKKRFSFRHLKKKIQLFFQ